MKIPLSLLKDFVDIDLTKDQISKTLTMAGLEVDSVIESGFECSQVIVCKVLQVEKHPQADKLSLATVTDGEHTYQVVCGASNCRVGIKTALAIVGATVLDDQGKPFKIKKSKIRGVESYGMLCAPCEIGLPGQDGIIEFSEHIKEGTDVMSMYADTVFEISITPNLGHCMSLLGVARELSAATKKTVRLPAISFQESSTVMTSDTIKLQLTHPKDCMSYACRLIKNVNLSASPDWLKNKLEALGHRSINNIVDVTNYVMLHLGYPLHAFDVDKIEGPAIHIRLAEKDEYFISLDKKQYVLNENDLVIADATKPIALAGIIGGMNSEVSDTTTTILLEAAYFNPSSIRRTSKRLGLSTDASKRFERGVDPNMITLALNFAADLIQSIAGGDITQGIVKAGQIHFPSKEIVCRIKRTNQVLGVLLNADEMEKIFALLEMKCRLEDDDTLMVDVPTYRHDMTQEIDLISEIARLYGYQHITHTSKFASLPHLPHASLFLFERQVRTRLLQEGLQEFLTCDLIGPSYLKIVQQNEEQQKGEPFSEKSQIHVLNPTSIEQSILRTSLIPGLLQVVKYNEDRQTYDIAGFEIGKVHFKEKEAYIEQNMVSIILSGKTRPDHWGIKPLEYDFFDLKGIVENFLKELSLPPVTFQLSHSHLFHPGRQCAIYVGAQLIGLMGEIHAHIQRRLDVQKRILCAEINLEGLYPLLIKKQVMEPLSLYPASTRDWTITLDKDMPIDHLFNYIESLKPQVLETSLLLDIYQDKSLGDNVKNATFRFIYRDKEKTLNQDIVDAAHTQLLTGLMQKISKSTGD